MQSIYNTQKAGGKVIVRDYIAGMTDGYALRCMREISLPEELSFDKRSK
jgi:dGTP triphosphohydrolase